MFVVVAHVEGDRVEGAIIRVGLEALVEHVVLGDEVARHRVEAHGHDGSSSHVEEDLATCLKKKTYSTWFTSSSRVHSTVTVYVEKKCIME